MMLGDSYIEQIGEVAIYISQFQISRALAVAMLAAFVILLPFGISLNSIFNFVPNTIVHWLPVPPRVVP